MQCILTANTKQMSWEETTRKKKMTDLCLGNVFQLPSRRISRKWTRSGTNLVIFLEAICAQTNLFCREMKILKSNTREENFSTLARHIKCSFLQVREESGLPVNYTFWKWIYSTKEKMICFKSWSYLRTCGKFIIQAPSKWTYMNETEYFGTVKFPLSGRFAFITKILCSSLV